MRGPPGGVRAAEPNSPRGAGGGRAPLGLELRPWEGNPHSPPAPGGGGRGGDVPLLPPQARGCRLAPRVRATRTRAGCCPGFLSPPLCPQMGLLQLTELSRAPVSYVTWRECRQRDG